MFSGIVETCSVVASAREGAGILAIKIKKPIEFNDIRHGDSIAVNGVCLTVDGLDEQVMEFTLGPETLQVTGWTAQGVQNKAVNLERSLRYNERIHGHLVTGHVDCTAAVQKVQQEGECLRLWIQVPKILQPLIWGKGSVAVNGVSLTVNSVDQNTFEVCIIPETLKRTNLGTLKAGDHVNLEADNMARGLLHISRGPQ